MVLLVFLQIAPDAGGKHSLPPDTVPAPPMPLKTSEGTFILRFA